jgi:hypothetical protein
MAPFGSWAALLTYLDAHSNIVFYHAPLDLHPVIVVVTKRFKNGKLRVRSGSLAFTADGGHLDRFRGKA